MAEDAAVESRRLSSDQEEADMRRKYPTAAAGRNALLEKRLSRGGQKFFDSGDYNMIKAAMDPKHKNKLNLGYPIAIHPATCGSKSPGASPTGNLSPLSFSPVNPLTPPTTPTDGAAFPGAMAPSTTHSAPARPPSSIDLYQRRLSRQTSRLASDFEAFQVADVDAAKA